MILIPTQIRSGASFFCFDPLEPVSLRGPGNARSVSGTRLPPRRPRRVRGHSLPPHCEYSSGVAKSQFGSGYQLLLPSLSDILYIKPPLTIVRDFLRDVFVELVATVHPRSVNTAVPCGL